jgi:hypothetical protein
MVQKKAYLHKGVNEMVRVFPTFLNGFGKKKKKKSAEAMTMKMYRVVMSFVKTARVNLTFCLRA